MPLPPNSRPAARRRTVVAGLVAALVSAALGFATGARSQVLLPTDFHDESMLTGLNQPVSFAFLPDGRVLLNELKSGRVRMVVGDAIATTDPVLTVDSLETGGEETGLLGIAIDPRWPSSPYVYLYYTAIGNTIRLARYTATGDLSNGESGLLGLDPASKRYLVRDVVSVNDNHNAGTLAFGPDSMLYASFGEDARACFSFNFDPTKLYGIIARMEVRNLPPSPGPYDLALLAPPDNPFPSHATPQGRLVYSYGLRNPFRFHIDAPTGQIFIADVGWEHYEEVDIATQGGQNFGWPYFEGDWTYVTNECGPPPPPPGLKAPAFQYDRASYGGGGAAIIGGVVYRPATGSTTTFPAEYDGDYFLSDYYEGFIWRLHSSGGVWSLAPVVPGQPNTRDWARGYHEVTQWTRGPEGSLYYIRLANDFTPGTGEFGRIVYRDPNVGVSPRSSNASITFAAPYPTPARGEVALAYALARSAPVRLVVFDAFGRRVRVLRDGATQDAGEHRLSWDGRDDAGRAAAPGVYLARLVAGDQVRDRRLILLR
jgi:glucose/arabinose dehydrogenase